MPTYRYRCSTCGEEHEVWQSFTEEPLKVHDNCGGELRRVLSPAGIVLKGSGFYKTDSRNGATHSSSSESKERSGSDSKSNDKKSAGSESGSSSGDKGSSDSKSGDSKSSSKSGDSSSKSTSDSGSSSGSKSSN